MTDKDKNPVDDITDFAEVASNLLSGVSDFAEEHGDDIKKITGSEEGLDLGDGSPLNSVDKNEDFVEVAIEAEESVEGNLTIERRGGELKMSIGEKSVTAEIPSDAKVDKATAIYNNGVLTVRIPRGGE